MKRKMITNNAQKERFSEKNQEVKNDKDNMKNYAGYKFMLFKMIHCAMICLEQVSLE